MNVVTQYNGKTYLADLSSPLDISIPINDGLNNPNCFYAPPPEFYPVRTDSFVGSRAEGGLLNFFNVKILLFEPI